MEIPAIRSELAPQARLDVPDVYLYTQIIRLARTQYRAIGWAGRTAILRVRFWWAAGTVKRGRGSILPARDVFGAWYVIIALMRRSADGAGAARLRC